MDRTNPTVLLIDDNQHGLVARRTGLEQQGYKVEIAKGGSEGIKILGVGGFDAVVTDFRTPDLDGSQLLVRLREKDPKTPIIILSGFAEKLGLTEASTGADAVLMKGPAELEDLVRALGRLIKRKPVRAQPKGRARRARAGA